MTGLLQDFRYAIRQLWKNPGFSAIAVLVLALGIGANTAIFSWMNSALLRPIYADKPDRLIAIFLGDAQGHGLSNHSYPDYTDYNRESHNVLSGLAAFSTVPANLVVGVNQERISVGLVSDNYFSVLGVRPMLGRSFLPEENARPGAYPVAIISESLWRRQFGSTRDLTEKTIWLNNSSYNVVGVIPEAAARMAVVAKIDVFVPLMMGKAITGESQYFSERRNKELMVVGRLRNGVSLAQAQAKFSVIAAQLQKEYPEAWLENGHPQPLTVVPESAIPFELRGLAVGFIALLMGAVGCVLLIACSNLANMLLVRATIRRKEIAIRLALGAKRARLVRQLFGESLLLAVLGGIGGFVIAVWGRHLLATFQPNLGVPIAIDLSLDHRVFAFSLAITALTALAFGLVPALQATKPEIAGVLKDGEQSQTGGVRRSRLRNWLMIGQVAVSLVLLMVAGIFLASVGRLLSSDLGFDSNNIALLSVDLQTQDNSTGRIREFAQQAVTRLEAVPGVESVAVAQRVPLGLDRVRQKMLPEGYNVPAEQAPAFGFNRVGPSYFETMRIPLLRGRVFNPQDQENSSQAGMQVAVVNQALAIRFWPNQNPIGKRIRELDGKTLEVVGVVKTGKYESLSEDPLPYVYLPFDQNYGSALTFHVRTRITPNALLDTLRRQLIAQDPAIAVFDVETMNEHIADSLFAVRLGAAILGLFGCFALTLASIGLFGLMAYIVSRRKKEIGIRIALGARPRDVLALVLRQGMGLIIYGALIGLVFGSILSTVIATQLYGVGGTDILTLAGVVLLQIGISLFACYLPARRAAKVDPVVALRYE